MSKNLDKLRTAAENAEGRAQKLMAEKDQALGKVNDRYAKRLRAATDAAADAQKKLLDAEAAEALLDRPDGEAVAKALGLKLP